MSLDFFNGLMETMPLLSTPANAAHLMQGLEAHHAVFSNFKDPTASSVANIDHLKAHLFLVLSLQGENQV